MKSLIMGSLLLATATAANAQSVVTLYGNLNAGIEYMSGIPSSGGGSTSRWRTESGDLEPSLWGLTGSEDLGGGYKAVFKLESAFNLMNGVSYGTAGTLFGHWATVGMSNDKYGTLLFGEELFISNGVWDFDPFGQTAWSSASLVHGRNWPTSANNISYQSPKIAGFDFYGQYSLSNATNWNGNGTTTQGREDGAQVTYSASLFQLRGLYDEIRNPANGSLDSAFQYSREYFAGANVFLGPVKLSLVYQTSQATNVAAETPSSTRQEWGGVNWQVTPVADLIAAVYHMNANNGAGNATLYSIGGTYNLSKRTMLDFQVATVRNSKTGTYGLEVNLPGNPDNPLPGHSQSGFYAGISHSF
jgi:predicted porin